MRPNCRSSLAGVRLTSPSPGASRPAITIGGGGRGAAHTLTEWYTNENGPRGHPARAAIALAHVGLAEGVTN
jgi:hypothetical protein